MTSDAGLEVTTLSWLIFALLVVTWLASAVLWRTRGSAWPRSLLMSLFGLAWAGFGVQIILRFVLLSYDSFQFGNMTDRLAIRPAAVINEALLCAWLYWVCVVIGFSLLSSRRRTGILGHIGYVSPAVIYRHWALIVLAGVSCVALTSFDAGLPAAFQTPVAVLGSTWVLPATVAWFDWYRQPRSAAHRRMERMALLVPGIVHAVLSPYREYLLLVPAVPIFAAAFAGHRFRLRRMAAAAIVLALLSTLAINILRRAAYDGEGLAQSAATELSWRTWIERPTSAPWMQMALRFHAFDSLLLTVDLVPGYFPHSYRNVFVQWIVQALVPRIVFSEKVAAQRGQEFSATIWSFDGKEQGVAAIAPSMPGDLYEAGGVPFVAFGALLWGLMLGALESDKRRVGPAAAAGVTALFAVQALMAVERDFVFSTATLAQTLLTMVLIAAFVSGRSWSQWTRRSVRPQESSLRVS